MPLLILNRMQQAVSERILRRVSTRDYAGVLDDVCDGYGIDKSSGRRNPRHSEPVGY